jgi:hypothetical protein
VLRAAELMFDESPRGVDINVDAASINHNHRRAFASNGRSRLLTTARATFDPRPFKS